MVLPLKGLSTWPLSSRGAQASLVTIPKKQSRNLVNFLRDRPGAVTDHAATASLRANPGSSLERTLQLFIGGWPARTVRGLGEDCGTYFEGPQCVCSG